ncbi:SufD family Fe-S cluster assembly protein [Pyrobaculum sp. 3827-6]|uniref:SufD family Fe-S cluster assembly protein n=1 Tax=Pyrobaculum sp. 3827-6 TaxID=2983604 RepID=UPI0021D85AF3|nr:SufD family Fe-S cluster assembly protein [Pyrobaculum sp. 3827-6]MCU7786828.1 SufD family Fe-S cluster assembly protein [Pyrobaculum sp. 3827-6]
MASQSWFEEVRHKARSALDKPAPYGPDIDVTAFGEGRGLLEEEAVASVAGRVGVSTAATAFYIQADNAYFRYLSRIPGVEVYRLEEFVEEYRDVARDYLWRLVPPHLDKYTAAAALRGVGGYVIRVKSGVKVSEPILACLSIVRGGLQAPHNVVIVEEGAEAVVYTGCAIAPEAVGLHVGISEFYVMKGARLRFIMVHSWNKAAHVRPRTGVLVEEGGEYVEYYANLASVKTLQTSPRIVLKEGARAHSVSVVLGLGDAVIDIGTVASLEGRDAGVELATRAIAAGSSTVTMRALVEAWGPARGHVECSGLLMSERANIVTIPQLAARHSDAALTHEASIGRLAEEEINYLMAKGFTYEEAVSLLVRGFVTTDIHKYLPEQARRYVENIEKLITEKAM